MAVHQNDEPVTWGDLRRVFKKLDQRIDEAFDAIATGDDNQSQFWDEHEDKINRIRREQVRMRRTLKELMGD